MTKQTQADVQLISPDKIERNPENPRLVFRTEELDLLLASIQQYGIQVPVTVYRKQGKYFLIDGERRWRCARKLGLKEIPALIQAPPSDLDNLLLMFNIHALREQWDYLTIAHKLPRIISLYADEHNGEEPNEIELSKITGLTRAQIRRCRLLLAVPQKYITILFEELELPKQRQRLSEDFFIEMERSLKTVAKHVEGAVKNLDRTRMVLIQKYREKKIGNITDFRKLAKIATSGGALGVKDAEVRDALHNIFASNGPGIAEVFESRFGALYDEKKITRQIDGLLSYLKALDHDDLQEPESKKLKKQLFKLKSELERLFEDIGNV